MDRRRLALLAGMGAALCGLTGGAAAQSRDSVARPRLVVTIAIDQFRADYLTRFQDLYLPPRSGDRVPPKGRPGRGGFRYLMSRGAWYPDCQYEHHRTVTAAGHAILGTGAQPAVNGIVGNTWFDRASGKSVYCVSDPRSTVVGKLPGSKETPMSPANLLVTTYGDELELATGGKARTVALALKDRASILLAGHRADTVLWIDEDTGTWITSSFYAPSGRLPEWVTELNGLKLPDRLRRKPWTPSVGAAALERAWKYSGKPFSWPLTGSDYLPFIASPAGNEFLFESARRAVTAEGLGQDEIPDVLSLNLSSNDYVGHRFGPESAEVLDISVQTDRQIADFLGFLAKAVPGGLGSVVVSISADHGVVPVPELNADSRVPVARSLTPALRDAAEKALDAAVGPADWIASTDNGEVYFSEAAVARYPREPRSRLEAIVADAARGIPGVYLCIGRSAVFSGQVPRNGLGQRVTQGMHPTRSGDVAVILSPQWLPGSAPVGSGTSHGSPFTDDTHVPLLVCGFGMRPGVYTQRVSPARLAPTLSHLLGVARPSGSDEPLLPGIAGAQP